MTSLTKSVLFTAKHFRMMSMSGLEIQERCMQEESYEKQPRGVFHVFPYNKEPINKLAPLPTLLCDTCTCATVKDCIDINRTHVEDYVSRKVNAAFD